jgi:hypothetical protein
MKIKVALFTLKLEAAWRSETLVPYHVTVRFITQKTAI